MIITEDGKIVQMRSSHTGNLGREQNKDVLRDSAVVGYSLTPGADI